MKQVDLFGSDSKGEEDKTYSSKIEAPIYEPKNKQPHILELCNKEKGKRLINRIESANITEEEKVFLKYAAMRHNVFNYEKIADYYAHASKDMQELMEQSALVIIDFEKAIQYGFIKLNDNIKKMFLTSYDNE